MDGYFHPANILKDSMVSSLGDMWTLSHLQSTTQKCRHVLIDAKIRTSFYTSQTSFLMIGYVTFIIVAVAEAAKFYTCAHRPSVTIFPVKIAITNLKGTSKGKTFQMCE